MSYSSTDNVKSTARDAMKDVGDAASRAATSAQAQAKSMGRDMADTAESLGDMAQDRIDGMANYVRRNPLQATAIAAGVGFVFALLARR
jgi:ElaB/YqjD/DUF883 family membrane-anchored ribosome-binding protein